MTAFHACVLTDLKKNQKQRDEKQVRLQATFPANIINDVSVAQSYLSSQTTICQRNIIHYSSPLYKKTHLFTG